MTRSNELKRVFNCLLFSQSSTFEVSFGYSLMLGSFLFLFVVPPSAMLTTILLTIGFLISSRGNYRKWKEDRYGRCKHDRR